MDLNRHPSLHPHYLSLHLYDDPYHRVWVETYERICEPQPISFVHHVFHLAVPAVYQALVDIAFNIVIAFHGFNL